MPSILLDTNVLVYAFDLHNSQKQTRAWILIRKLDIIGAGCLSVQCLAEFFRATTVKFHLRPEEMCIQVERWQRAFPVYDLTPQIVLEAARGTYEYGLSYYDAQIWASAHLNSIPNIFSEDFQDGQLLEGVRFVNPFTEVFKLDDWS
jgi:predicted nucleic acid-binding protein